MPIGKQQKTVQPHNLTQALSALEQKATELEFGQGKQPLLGACKHLVQANKLSSVSLCIAALDDIASQRLTEVMTSAKSRDLQSISDSMTGRVPFATSAI